MLHRVGVAAAAEDLEAFTPQQLTFFDAVILVPDPAGVAVAVPVVHGVGQPLLAHDSVADAPIRRDAASILDATVDDNDVVPFFLQPNGETQSGEMVRGDHESHTGL